MQRLISAGVVGLFVLCFFVSCSSSPDGAKASAEALRVMTFNIRYDEPRDGENSWPVRMGPVAGTIVFFKTDVAGLQEALITQVRDLENQLPDYAWVGVGRDDGKEGGEFCPIFYLRDRFRLLDHSTFWLSETPGKPGLPGWDAACARVVTWAHLKDGWGGSDFHVFNTHFDHVGRRARKESADLLLEKIAEIAGSSHVIVTGDFNCTERDPPYEILTSPHDQVSPLSDTRYLSRQPPYGSTYSFNGFSSEIGSRYPIDHIFLRYQSPVFRWGIISDSWDGRFVSDHYPVFAEIRLARR